MTQLGKAIGAVVMHLTFVGAVGWAFVAQPRTSPSMPGVTEERTAKTMACRILPLAHSTLQPLLPAVAPTVGFSLPGFGASSVAFSGLLQLGCQAEQKTSWLGRGKWARGF